MSHQRLQNSCSEPPAVGHVIGFTSVTGSNFDQGQRCRIGTTQQSYTQGHDPLLLACNTLTYLLADKPQRPPADLGRSPHKKRSLASRLQGAPLLAPPSPHCVLTEPNPYTQITTAPLMTAPQSGAAT